MEHASPTCSTRSPVISRRSRARRHRAHRPTSWQAPSVYSG